MQKSLTVSPWFEPIQLRPTARLRLFCFPFVGSDATIFRSWTGCLPDTVEVIALQYPGRGRRSGEPPLTSLTSLTGQIADAMSLTEDRPFALFGHSMGGVVAFELTRHLQKKNRTVPQCLFVSGSKPPHARLVPSQPGRRSVSLLPDAEFIAELRKLNGTPPELLEDIRTLNFFLPRLRADFAVIETAEYELGSTVSCPISAFCGSNDNIAPLPSMMLWKDLTRGTFDYQLIPGDHFFLLRSRPRLLNALIPKLEQLSSSVLFC